MTALITLSSAGADTGPFNLFSDVTGYASAFNSNVPKASLLAGYSTADVPSGTTIIRVKSVGNCNNYTDVTVVSTTTTTTTVAPTTTTTSTTSTTTTLAPTTTTTTTATPLSSFYKFEDAGAGNYYLELNIYVGNSVVSINYDAASVIASFYDATVGGNGLLIGGNGVSLQSSFIIAGGSPEIAPTNITITNVHFVCVVDGISKTYDCTTDISFTPAEMSAGTQKNVVFTVT